MIMIGKETFLLAAEAARELKVSRSTFYKSYKPVLQEHKVGQLRRKHFRLSEIEQANSIKAYPIAS